MVLTLKTFQPQTPSSQACDGAASQGTSSQEETQGTTALQNFLMPCFPLDKLQINQLIREQVLPSTSSTGTSTGAPGRAQAAVGQR